LPLNPATGAKSGESVKARKTNKDTETGDYKALSQIFTEEAKKQLALDYNCAAADFSRGGAVLSHSALNTGRRLFFDTPFFLNIATFGSGTVISAAGKIFPFAEKIAQADDLFTPPIMSRLYAVAAAEHKVLHQTISFLPKESVLQIPQIPEDFTIRIVDGEDILRLYRYGFDNAFCKKTGARRDVAAAIILTKSGKIAAAAGASNDSERFLQIGIDTLPEYRRKNLAKALITTLSNEIIDAGKIPYYCAVPSNILSHKTALSSGFTPAWFEISIK
jgi:hypothetical protein